MQERIRLICSNTGVDLESKAFKTLTKKEQARRVVYEGLILAGKIAGKCYSPDSWDVLKSEKPEIVEGRKNFCLKKMHHSMFDHIELTFEMDQVPKFIFMLLNNENVYTTSEQSARYTDFLEACETQDERFLYDKWKTKLTKIIGSSEKLAKHMLTCGQSEKLAGENARYMISVFTRSSMIHTISLRQLNYVMYYMENFLKEYEENDSDNSNMDLFVSMLRPVLEKFLEDMSIWKVDGLIPKTPTKLSMFKQILSEEEFADSSYQLNYMTSFAAQAQNQRHRTIRYRISLPEKPTFYVPPIIIEAGLEKEWKSDLLSIADLFPQAMLINVQETGDIEDFVRKCYERCCGRAQLEISVLTTENLRKLYSISSEKVKDYLKKTTNVKTSRCTFPGYKCTEPCSFGKDQFDRII